MSDDYILSAMGINVSTFTTGSSASTITLDDIKRAINLIPEDPLAKWMREQGFPPEKGGVLLMPAEYAHHFRLGGPPDYVRLTPHVSEPALMMTGWDLNRQPI